MKKLAMIALGGLLSTGGTAASAADPGAPDDAKPLRVFWGDTHVHSSISLDANLFGMTDVGPETAYRFARGEKITAANGATAQLARPLDFLVVSDHAEYLGIMPLLRAGNESLLASPVAREWRATLASGDAARFGRMMVDIGHSYEAGKPLLTLPADAPSPWHANNRAADAAYAPGEFTTFIGFEWSAMPGGDNLHRVVLLRDGAARADRVTPFSAFDGDDPRDLWRWLQDYEDASGGRAMAIPHNSNLSGGRMFAVTDDAGRPLDADYASRRQRWEPLVEVTQIKGDSEAHPLLSPDDPFADYGTWDQYNIAMSEPQTPQMHPYQYARPALQLGLGVERRTGVNPFRFGLIGSSDSHSAPGAIAEDNFWGKKAGDEPGPRRSQAIWGVPEAGMSNTLQLASGHAAVWARENTREAIFEAMQRREVYATTGPRMLVQFFGGWRLHSDALESHEKLLLGDDDGVPMGAVLPEPPENAGPPRFMLRALKDPDGANLDRVQVVKGWVDAEGRGHEKVYDVAWSDARKPGPDGQLPPVGNTVEQATATYDNSIGSAELSALWQDPQFDPALPAVYYMRVLEIPTPRWTLYDKVRFGVDLPPGTQTVQQERAYTSPIWYRPPVAAAP
jgi:hypothetical protein